MKRLTRTVDLPNTTTKQRNEALATKIGTVTECNEPSMPHRSDSKHDLGIGINPILGQTKSTCYMNLTGTKQKPLNTNKTLSKPKSCTKKANMAHKHITNDWTLCFDDKVDSKVLKQYTETKHGTVRRGNKAKLSKRQDRYTTKRVVHTYSSNRKINELKTYISDLKTARMYANDTTKLDNQINHLKQQIKDYVNGKTS